MFETFAPNLNYDCAHILNAAVTGQALMPTRARYQQSAWTITHINATPSARENWELFCSVTSLVPIIIVIVHSINRARVLDFPSGAKRHGDHCDTDNFTYGYDP